MFFHSTNRMMSNTLGCIHLLTVFVVALMGTPVTDAWGVVPNSNDHPHHQRNTWFPSQQLAIAAASVSVALTMGSLSAMAATTTILPINFVGSYADPFHLNCQRIIRSSVVVGKGNAVAEVTLTGTDGNPSCPADGSGNAWTLQGKVVDNDSILVDFTPKGGPKDLKGVWDGDGIRWPDGNKWTIKLTTT
jgi:hypothetical protein